MTTRWRHRRPPPKGYARAAMVGGGAPGVTRPPGGRLGTCHRTRSPTPREQQVPMPRRACGPRRAALRTRAQLLGLPDVDPPGHRPNVHCAHRRQCAQVSGGDRRKDLRRWGAGGYHGGEQPGVYALGPSSLSVLGMTSRAGARSRVSAALAGCPWWRPTSCARRRDIIRVWGPAADMAQVRTADVRHESATVDVAEGPTATHDFSSAASPAAGAGDGRPRAAFAAHPARRERRGHYDYRRRGAADSAAQHH